MTKPLGRRLRRISLAVAAGLALLAVLLLVLDDRGWEGAGGPRLEARTEGGHAEPDLLAPHLGEVARAARLRGRSLPGAAETDEYRRPASADDLHLRGGWAASLRGLVVAQRAQPERRTVDILDDHFRRARLPVSRQNLIFQMALCVDPGESTPWLADVASGEGADADDALMALAFLDDPAGAAHLRAMAAEPLRGNAGVDDYYDHEAKGEENGDTAREILRPYRAIEVLLRRCYFIRTGHEIPVHFVAGRRPDALALLDLLHAWLARYPDHPGVDDVAIYVARIHVQRGDLREAARWYARSCTTGDTDAAGEGIRGWLALTELLLGEHELPGLHAGLDAAPCFEDLLDYVRLRRAAARGDLAGALAEAETLAALRPRSAFAYAWPRRWSSPPPRGLQSGLEALAPDDELCREEAQQDPSRFWDTLESTGSIWSFVRWGPWVDGRSGLFSSGGLFARGSSHRSAGRIAGPRGDELARQLRLWTTLEELRRRAARARGVGREDLEYKIAALLYHDPEAFFPAYTRRHAELPELYGLSTLAPRLHAPAAWRDAYERFEREAHGEWRAAFGFAELAATSRDERLRELALFSRGQALRRFVGNARALKTLRKEAARAIVPTFETFLLDHPDSSFAPDARRAIAYWRKVEPTIQGTGR